MPVHEIPPTSVQFQGPAPSFPARCEINALLVPRELFGMEQLTGRLALRPSGQPVPLTAVPLHGGIRRGAGGRLPKLDLPVGLFDLQLRVHEDVALVTGELSSDAAFRKAIHVVRNYLPSFLSAALRSPVGLSAIFGVAGGTRFEVVATGSFQALVRVLDSPREVAALMSGLAELPEDQGLRVLTAFRYLNQTRWLGYAAEYPSQFVGEQLLNLQKALEILFSPAGSVDRLREQLRAIGLRKRAVELIAASQYVRNEIDVGHAKTQLLSAEEYADIHEFVMTLTELLTELLPRIIGLLAQRRFALPPLERSAQGGSKTMRHVRDLLRDIDPLRPDSWWDQTQDGNG